VLYQNYWAPLPKGVGRKNSRGATEKNRKNSKTDRKLALLNKGVGRKMFRRGGGQRKKDRKIAKKDRNIALFSIYLPNMYHVWKSRGEPRPPAPRRWRPCPSRILITKFNAYDLERNQASPSAPPPALSRLRQLGSSLQTANTFHLNSIIISINISHKFYIKLHKG